MEVLRFVSHLWLLSGDCLTDADGSNYVLQVLIPSQYCASSSRLASARRVLSVSSHMT